MDPKKRKALRKAYGYIIEKGATLPADTDAAMTRLGIKTATYYEQVLTRLVKSLYKGNIDLLEFLQTFGDLAQGQLTRAWAEGMRANGLDPNVDMTEELQAELDQIILDEKTNISGFADEIYQASNLTGQPIDPYLNRIDMWANRYDDVVNQAKLATAGGGKLKWVYGDTDHCVECEALSGIVAFASEWDDAGVHPQQPPNSLISCGGWRCQCTLEPTTERHTRNAADKIASIVGGTGKSLKSAVLPPQLAEDPKDANAAWLKDHDPRLSVYMTGTDPKGQKMTAWLVNGEVIRTNIWNDWTDAGNHARYPWNPPGEYWLDAANASEYEYNLIHEVVEDRTMQANPGMSYGKAHEDFANPAEYQARHGDAKQTLRELGWEVSDTSPQKGGDGLGNFGHAVGSQNYHYK